VSKNREEGFDIGLGGLFKGVGTLFELLSKMTEEGKGEFSQTGELSGLPGKAKGVYGFSIKTGIGGKPVVEQFGNIKETEKGVLVEEIREPLTDIIVEEERVLVIAEVPGIEEEKVKIEINGDILNLEAEGAERKYAKEILLPSPVEEKPEKVSLKNGILEITLLKKRSR